MRQQANPIVPESLANVRVVLVEPQTAGNIGSTARAMKTMGLSRLTLVNPVEFRTVPEVRWLAHGADDVLDAAMIVPSLDEALTGVVFAVGTTNRPRGTWLSPIYCVYVENAPLLAAGMNRPLTQGF